MTPQLIIITGLSGSGMSTAMNVFEDMGYFCVDNLPVQLINSFVHLFDMKESGITRAALSVNIREGEFLKNFPQVYSQLRAREDLETTVVFMEAGDEVLQRRYSETRRPHPLGDEGVLDGILEERARLETLRELADIVINTSNLSVHSLKDTIRKRFSTENLEGAVRASIVSFGFKYGIPLDVDLLFDVRFLPNPYFVPELKELTGNDYPLVEYLETIPEYGETITRLNNLFDFLMPLYQREGKSYITIGIGCTGGKHRSVATANAIGKHLKRAGLQVRVLHRDVKK